MKISDRIGNEFRCVCETVDITISNRRTGWWLELQKAGPDESYAASLVFSRVHALVWEPVFRAADAAWVAQLVNELAESRCFAWDHVTRPPVET